MANGVHGIMDLTIPGGGMSLSVPVESVVPLVVGCAVTKVLGSRKRMLVR